MNQLVDKFLCLHHHHHFSIDDDRWFELFSISVNCFNFNDEKFLLTCSRQLFLKCLHDFMIHILIIRFYGYGYRLDCNVAQNTMSDALRIKALTVHIYYAFNLYVKMTTFSILNSLTIQLLSHISISFSVRNYSLISTNNIHSYSYACMPFVVWNTRHKVNISLTLTAAKEIQKSWLLIKRILWHYQYVVMHANW